MGNPKVTVLSKSSLDIINSRSLSVLYPQGMSISHFAYSTRSYDSEIPFTIEGVEGHAPYVYDTEFSTAIRHKVDFSANGINQTLIKQNGLDIGEYNHKNVSPTIPVDLPPGFKEVYRRK